MQLLLPIFPTDIKLLSPSLGVQKIKDFVHYYHCGAPIYQHPSDDLNHFRFYTSNLIDQGRCDGKDVCRVFEVSYASVLRSLKKFRKEGVEGFFGKDSRHGSAHKMLPDLIDKIQKQLDKGKSNNSIAKKAGISEGTIRYALSKGVLKKKLLNSRHQKAHSEVNGR